MQNYRNLIAWQKSHLLAVRVHRLTQSWSRYESAGLIGQMRRAALSVPSNLAEGAGRNGDKDFAKFVQIAIGSTTELEYQLDFAAETGIGANKEVREVQNQIVEVRRILYGLLKKLRSGSKDQT